ncbi:MAG: hypothetical protein JO309_15600 [Pseudonocardiales bacterium]|nr:hypothetical protein [Pseudonocardiales bacterium]MBV9730797.1 hypothetical protein [Pseudonocardiales bacterium]
MTLWKARQNRCSSYHPLPDHPPTITWSADTLVWRRELALTVVSVNGSWPVLAAETGNPRQVPT